ncbi:hypothetical protein K502DRAFT_323272, partial [Neoconidiobolus thromboides FSU 785]
MSTYTDNLLAFFKSLTNSSCSCHKKDEIELIKDKQLLKQLHSSELTVMEKLFMKAVVVTMESKYYVHPSIAEFWCTITSIFFAFPLYLLLEFESTTMDPIMTCFILLSVITAISSFTYHWTLYKLFSSADAAFATIMVVLVTFALLGKNPTTYPIENSPIIWGSALAFTTLIFIKFWEDTATTSLIIFALVLPTNFYCMLQLGYYKALVTGIIGISCFIIDRKGVAPTHSCWHFFGGLYLYYLGQQLCL